jgi:hypothetical protein
MLCQPTNFWPSRAASARARTSWIPAPLALGLLAGPWRCERHTTNSGVELLSNQRQRPQVKLCTNAQSIQIRSGVCFLLFRVRAARPGTRKHCRVRAARPETNKYCGFAPRRPLETAPFEPRRARSAHLATSTYVAFRIVAAPGCCATERE